MKVAWNLKGGGISGFTMAHDELPVLHDVFSSAIASGCQKTSYIVQFLWRDLTSGFDLIGPYFPVPNSMDSNVLQEFFMLCLKAFTAYGFRVAIVLCDGASSNLTLLKMLCDHFQGQHSPLMRRQQMRELGTLWTCCLLTQRILREIQYLQ